MIGSVTRNVVRATFCPAIALCTVVRKPRWRVLVWLYPVATITESFRPVASIVVLSRSR